MMGDAKAWRRLLVLVLLVYGVEGTHENMLPRAPPKRTISYLESIGRAKEAL